MKHTVPHDLGKERAKKVTESALTTYSEKFAKYNPQTTWPTPYRAQISFKVKGMSLSGTVDVKDTTIDLDLDVPFLLKPFQGQAISVIDGEIKTWLAKEKG